MARQEINLGTPPTGVGGDSPRSTGVKINAMTQELYQGLDATTKGGWGKADAIRLPDGTNLNNLPAINAIYTITGTSNTNGPEGNSVQNGHILVQCADIFIRQTYRQMGDNRTWERSGQLGSGGAWGAWKRTAQVGGDLGNGLGGENTFNGNIDTLIGTAPRGLTTYNLSSITTGSLPPGFAAAEAFNASTLMMMKWNNDWGRQWLSGGVGGVGGAIGGTFTRLVTSGSYTPWLLEYNHQNALNPVDSANGRVGVMDNQIIGSWRVTRFANGFVSCGTQFNNITVAPGELKGVQFTIPVYMSDYGKSSIHVGLSPTQTNDHYGVISTVMNSPTTGTLVVRNGPVAQEFGSTTIVVTGYWK